MGEKEEKKIERARAKRAAEEDGRNPNIKHTFRVLKTPELLNKMEIRKKRIGMRRGGDERDSVCNNRRG